MLHPVAWDVQFDDYAMMHQPVDRRRRHHRVFEDRFPFREWQVAGHQHAAPFVPLGQQGEHHFHVVPALLQIPQIVDDQMVSSLASSSRIDSTAITASLSPSNSSRKASSTCTSPSSAASFRIFKYSLLDR